MLLVNKLFKLLDIKFTNIQYVCQNVQFRSLVIMRLTYGVVCNIAPPLMHANAISASTDLTFNRMEYAMSKSKFHSDSSNCCRHQPLLRRLWLFPLPSRPCRMWP